MKKIQKIKKLLVLMCIVLASMVTRGYAQKATLKGNVNGIDGLEITGATVSAGRLSIASDEKGFYILRNLQTGKTIITVQSLGYESFRDTVNLVAGEQTFNAVLKKRENQLNAINVNAIKEGNRNAESLIKIENSIMPVTIIDRRTIELMGSRRLDEVLKEQTGVAIVNDIAGGSRSVGVQMQGFGGEYIMVLIDGQPMVGRSSGNFDLSRISVSNIERVEITKGAASNIYGGDALGGTINVITRHAISQPQAFADISYGNNETVDASLNGETPVLAAKGSISLGGNYYHTGGFNTGQGLVKGTTSPPYDNYAGQGRFRYRFNDNNLLSVSGRYGLRRSFMKKDYGVKYSTEDVLDEEDLNLSINFDHRFSKSWRSMTRYYFTRYDADMSIVLSQGDSISQNKFGQALHRLEQQFSFTPFEKLEVVNGFGGTLEQIDEQALSKVNDIKAYFAFSQANWQVHPKLELTFGLRYDRIVNYGWRLDPSGAIKYRILPSLSIKAAYGTAFKAPDMKKLYQIFYNPAYNYTMAGSYVLRDMINQMREAGQVSQYELEKAYDEIKGKALNAEMSKSYNISLIWENPGRDIRIEGSVFRHDITNQINTVLIGTAINGGLIYSYRNHARAYYQGAELSVNYKPVNGLQLSGGYQYLIAKDRIVEGEIREGGKYYDPLFDPYTGYVNYEPSGKDYWGMENRSLHMFNARAFYTYRPLGLTANVRVNYRGKYPFSDKNNNGYMDRFDTFVRSYYLLNAGLEKKLMDRRLAMRFNAENLLNFVDIKVPSQPGRIFFLGISYNFYNNKQ